MKPARKQFSESTWFYMALVLVLAVPLFMHLLGDRLVDGHDAVSGLIRAVCMERNWGGGQFLARWVPDINYGYGSPMFDFYPPFFYYVTLLLSQITHNTVLSMNLTCMTFWLMSGIGMYLLAREFWSEAGGVLSAALYMYAPYYVQDLYVRGAFSEFSIFMIFPFMLLSVYKINDRFRMRYACLGAVAAAVSILTHGLGVFFVVVAFFYAVFLFFLKKNCRAFLLAAAVLLTGVMISAFFWLPALAESKDLNLDFLISMRYDFHKNFISVRHLFGFPWDRSKDMNGLSFQLGFVQLAMLALSILALLRGFRKNRFLRAHYMFFMGVALAAIVLTLPLSVILWEHMTLLRFIQLPWRFLTVAAFTISLLSGSSVLLFNKKTLQWSFLIMAVILAVLSPARYYWPGSFKIIDPAFVNGSLSGYLLLGEGERTPKWIKVPPRSVPLQKFEIIKGEGSLLRYKSDNPVDHSVAVAAGQSLMVCFHSFYFPGWRVLIDGHETEIYPDNIYGLIVFLVPPGEHVIRAVFGATPVRTVGAGVSLAGLLLLFIFIFCGGYFKSILCLKNPGKKLE